MSFQFCCPQGHVLQGDPSQVGQLFQCPMCGSSFMIPPPEMSPVAPGGFFQGQGTWPGNSTPAPAFPAMGGMPGMAPPQTMPMMPGQMPMGPMPGAPMASGPMMPGQMPPASYPLPSPQPFAFNPTPLAPMPAAPAPAPQDPQTAPSETAKAGFDLGFDPNAKAVLPFDLLGQSESQTPAEQSPAAPNMPAMPAPMMPAPMMSPPMMPGAAFPPAEFPQPPPAAAFPARMPAPGDFAAPSLLASSSASDPDAPEILQSIPAAAEESAAAQTPPKILHIRCPSGHLVTAKSDLLGKNGRCPACKQTFELRYEDSVEFQRRTQKILHREEVQAGKAWVAWGFFAAFLLFVGLVVLMLALSR